MTAKIQYWLMKSEPDEYSITDLKRDTTEMWDGVRNYQVRNMMRDDMRVEDKALFYHSNAGKETGVVGVMTIASAAYPDPTQFDARSAHPDPKSDPANPRWLCIDVKYEKTLPRTVTLQELKAYKSLANMKLLQKGNRLSVMPVTKQAFEQIVKIADM